MIKRTFDLLASTIAVFFMFPVLVLLALAVRIFLGSPIFFVQQRPGLNGAPFVLVKFRTMIDPCSDHGVLLSDSDRLTYFGKLLRSTSLDELPELWNVLK